MGKVSNFLIGAALGATVGLIINYLFAPAPGTEFNKNYRSRLDKAIEEGKQAAEEHERELRQQLEAAKRGTPLNPPQSGGD
jgi:gas vesicle protein